ncbi:MAG: carboxypeptidase-like regulatory domain-containing protein [Bacteroidota bacterium]
MKKLACTLIFILLSCHLFAQDETHPFTIRGLIYDEKTNERLEGAVVSSGDNASAMSDKTGFFQLRLDRKAEKLKVKLVGYEEKNLVIDFDDESEVKLIIRLTPEPILLQGVTVTGEHFTEEPVVNSYSIHPGDLSKVPQFIEADAFRAFQALPGVTTAADMSSQISVRGGNYDETLVFLDGIPVYNPYHLVGVFSMFNSDILQNERLYMSNYPVSYGGALSSVLELNSKQGNNERIKGSAALGLASAKIALDGPLWGGNFLISGRRTYFDFLTRMIMGIRFPYYFYDLYSKYVYPLSKNNLLTVSAFYSRDALGLDDDKVFVAQKEIPNWGNLFLNFSDEYFLKEKSSVELKAFMSRASLGVNTQVFFTDYYHQMGTTDTTTVNNYIEDFTARLTFNSHPDGQALAVGLEAKREAIHYDWNIDETDLNGMYIHPLESLFFDFAPSQYSYSGDEFYLNAFVTDKVTISPVSELTAGLRGSYIKNLKTFLLLPSFSFSYNFLPNLQVHLSYGRYFQNTYSLKERKTEAVFTPFMATFFPEDKENIPYSDHYASGLVLSDIFSEKTSLEVEGYFKKRNNLATTYGPDEELKYEKGYAAGLDVLLKKEEGDLTGWLGYSFLHSVKKDEVYYYYAPLDRTHNVKILMNYALSNSWQLNAFWTFSTGLPYTVPIGKYIGPPDDGSGFVYYQEPHSLRLIEGRRNSERFKEYHRLDLGISGSFMWGSILYKPYLQVMNVYNSPNPYNFEPSSWQVTPQEGQERGSTIFPVIGITAEF